MPGTTDDALMGSAIDKFYRCPLCGHRGVSTQAIVDLNGDGEMEEFRTFSTSPAACSYESCQYSGSLGEFIGDLDELGTNPDPARRGRALED